MSRMARCECGAIGIVCEGEPTRRSVCHCLACQRRTGGAFGAQWRFPRDMVETRGAPARYTRKADSGGEVTFAFCPNCGTTLWWTLSSAPGVAAVALGGFADPAAPAPEHSVFEATRHPWVGIEAPVTRQR